MREFSAWLCTMPYGLGLPFFTAVSRSSLSKRLLAQLLLLAEDARTYVRAHALYYLGKLKDPSASAVLLSALKQEEESVLISAALAASELRLQEASASLNKLLSHSKADVKLSAALAVLSLKPDSAEAIVERLRRNKAPAAREALEKFLLHLGNLPEGPILIEKVLQHWELSDKDSYKLSASITRGKLLAPRIEGSKGTFESPAIEELLKAGTGFNAVMQAIGKSAPDHVRQFIRGMMESSANGGRTRAQVYPESLSDTELARDLLGFPRTPVSAFALCLLVLQPSPEGLGLLLEILGGTDVFMRRTAAEILGGLRAHEAIPLLVQMARSTDDEDRDIALEALWSIASSE